MKWLLPVLFIAYYSNIAIFMHAHLEDGILIMHSHPFSDATGGASHHHKSLTEILFFHDLSTVSIADGVIHSMQLQVINQQLIRIVGNPVYPEYLTRLLQNLFLRAPPVID